MSKTNEEKDEVSLKEMVVEIRKAIIYVLKKWKTILLVSIFGGLIGFTYASLKKTYYVATTTFVLESSGSDNLLGQYSGLASMVGIDMGGNGNIFQGDNVLELYKSHAMIYKTLLSKDPASSNSLIESYLKVVAPENRDAEIFKVYAEKKTESNERKRDSVLNSVVNTIRKDLLKVSKPDKKLSIIQVDFRFPNERFAKVFNNAIVSTVNSFYLETKNKKNLATVKILQFKTDSVRAGMNGAINRAAVIADEMPNLNPTRQSQRIIPSQRAEFSLETNKAILSVLTQNLELSKISLLRETPLIQILDVPIYPLQKEKLGRLPTAVIGAFLLGFCCCVWLFMRWLFSTNHDN